MLHEEREVNQDQDHGENGSETQVPSGRRSFCNFVEWTWNNRDKENERDKEHDCPRWRDNVKPTSGIVEYYLLAR